MNTEAFERMQNGRGFVAALDQSGGSTAKALKLYGIDATSYSGEAAMFDLVHAMRTRIITSPVFNRERILAVILFEMTMDREINGLGSAEYLWQEKGIVPFLKIDNGLAEEIDGVELMKAIPEIDARLASAQKHGVFGTKMRSLIKLANSRGIQSCIDQQFQFADRVLSAGLVPIIEPEIDINSPDKSLAESIMKAMIVERLDSLAQAKVMLKLTLPTQPGFYAELAKHPNVLRVVALSGGYTRTEANAKLAENPMLIASFSRALTEGLQLGQSQSEFDQNLDASIESIFQASVKWAP
ncbi:MAG: fructose bisphosphate aldolase [Actinobacteria bacterium]|uniref:fructose-bisphosphate aldolase n=1 Tax=freshwater metagenome TaxID=449393 RepID=A0A6J6R428_9ZZZZ|nr:fructose bisphosphate aldolase [Actinomycetota bacterium]MSZ64325.1 fructose bisphosphate aldolase [Actinomycetota bacterium]MTA58092.1 fructose bisphosphate aldolase [Actinomycetota bacterium]